MTDVKMKLDPKLRESINQTSEEQIGTFREFSQIYNKMAEICFSMCVWDFGTDQVRNREDRCAMTCAEKYLKMTKVLGASFAEGQANAILAAREED